MAKKIDFLKQNKTLFGIGCAVFFIAAFLFTVNNQVGIKSPTPKSAVHAAGTGALSLSPSSGTYNINSTLTVTVNESSTDAINAVESDLTYNATELQFVSASCSSTLSLSGSATGGSGNVFLACAVPNTTVTGNQTVGTVTFTVIGGGSSVVSFASTSAMIRASDQVNVWNGITTGGKYNLASPPSTSITSPSNGNLVHGSSLPVNASASDVIGVTKVDLNVDGTLVISDTTAPYTFSLNSMTYKDGSHTLTTVAHDAAGLSTTSSTITVTFNNGDVNSDGHVNISDLAILASNWGKPGMTYAQGDLNGDGKVNISDLSILADYYGQI